MVLKIRLSKIVIILFFIASISVGILKIELNLSSYAFALTVPLTIVCLLLIIKHINYNIKYDYLLLVLLFSLILYLQLLISIYSYGFDGLNKSLFSLFILTIISLLSPVAYKLIINVKDDFFIKVIYSCYLLMIFIGYTALVLQKIGFIQTKSMILFSEPSHYGIAIFPFFFFVVRMSRNALFHFSLFFLLALLIQNVTMLVSLFLALLANFKIHKIIFVKILLFFLSFFLLELSFFQPDYFKKRLLLDTSNISSLAYLSGWETAYLSFIDSEGLGVGFNRMGFVGPVDGQYREILRSMGLGDLNVYDGTVNGAKLITETGIIGLLLLLLYLYYFINVFKKLKKGTYKDAKSLFFSSVFLAMFIEYFVRGVGYFSPNIILFLTSVYWLSIKKGQLQ